MPLVHIHNRANPLRKDPTRTTLLRRSFLADIHRRFAQIKKDINNFLLDLDALGLKERPGTFTMLAQFRQYAFQTSDAKLKAFNQWLADTIESKINAVEASGNPWTTKYISGAYKRGITNAYTSAKKADLAADEAMFAKGQEQFLKKVLTNPEVLSKAQLLGTRTFENMKGVTATMKAQMNQILSQGMVEGKGVQKIAKEMADKIGGLEKTRAMVIARTEIIHAHAEGQLATFKELDINQIGIKAEWSTAGDDRVCPECAPLEGRIFTLDEAEGLIPLHPNCRCTWIPSV